MNDIIVSLAMLKSIDQAQARKTIDQLPSEYKAMLLRHAEVVVEMLKEKESSHAKD